jgi:hypothetical protein
VRNDVDGSVERPLERAPIPLGRHPELVDLRHLVEPRVWDVVEFEDAVADLVHRRHGASHLFPRSRHDVMHQDLASNRGTTQVSEPLVDAIADRGSPERSRPERFPHDVEIGVLDRQQGPKCPSSGDADTDRCPLTRVPNPVRHRRIR